MASRNPSGKPDMMPFPGVRWGSTRRLRRKCRLSGAPSETIPPACPCAPMVSAQGRDNLTFCQEHPLLWAALKAVDSPRASAAWRRCLYRNPELFHTQRPRAASALVNTAARTVGQQTASRKKFDPRGPVKLVFCLFSWVFKPLLLSRVLIDVGNFLAVPGKRTFQGVWDPSEKCMFVFQCF